MTELALAVAARFPSSCFPRSVAGSQSKIPARLDRKEFQTVNKLPTDRRGIKGRRSAVVLHIASTTVANSRRRKKEATGAKTP